MGVEEPSSEDDDEEAEEGGMLADVDESGEDSDASPEGARRVLGFYIRVLLGFYIRASNGAAY